MPDTAAWYSALADKTEVIFWFCVHQTIGPPLSIRLPLVDCTSLPSPPGLS